MVSRAKISMHITAFLNPMVFSLQSIFANFPRSIFFNILRYTLFPLLLGGTAVQRSLKILQNPLWLFHLLSVIMPFTNFAGTLILHIHLLFALVSARAYASPAPQVTPAPTAPWADCKLESAAPCHGIVYDPPSWCQAQATNIMYYPISSATGTAACDFTKEPTTSVERLGILSTYAAAERTSCLTYLGLTAVVTEPTTIALTKTSTSSTESVASKTTKSTSSAVSTLTPKQKGQLETYLKNAKIAGGFGFTGVITFTTILGIVNLDVHLVAAAEQAAAGAAGNVLELFLGTDVTEAVWTSFVAISLGAMAGALLVALAMVPFFIYEIIEAKIVEFRNNDDKKWPKTMTAYNKDAAGAEAAWAIRLFSDEGCGNHPLNYGASLPTISICSSQVSNRLC